LLYLLVGRQRPNFESLAHSVIADSLINARFNKESSSEMSRLNIAT
jgi:hypothetical protein